MNENKKKCKAWPLAAAALALGLGGVVGASAVYADRADDAANLPTAQSVKMRSFVEGDVYRVVLPYGNYIDENGDSCVIDSSINFPVTDDPILLGNSLEDIYRGEYEFPIEDHGVTEDGRYWDVSLTSMGSYKYVSLSVMVVDTDSDDVNATFVWDYNAGSLWSSVEVGDFTYNLNTDSKGLIGETFDAVAGGVTGVANTIGTSVTSVVGLFWDVENVRFTTLGTLTLVGLAAGLVYFAIRTIYRAVNGVA